MPEAFLVHVVPDLILDLLVGAGARQIGPCRIHIHGSAAKAHELRVAIGNGRATEVNLGDGTGNAAHEEPGIPGASDVVVADVVGAEGIYALIGLQRYAHGAVTQAVVRHRGAIDAAPKSDADTSSVDVVARYRETVTNIGCILTAIQVYSGACAQIGELVVADRAAIGPGRDPTPTFGEGVVGDGRVIQLGDVETAGASVEGVAGDHGTMHLEVGRRSAKEHAIHSGIVDVVVRDCEVVVVAWRCAGTCADSGEHVGFGARSEHFEAIIRDVEVVKAARLAAVVHQRDARPHRFRRRGGADVVIGHRNVLMNRAADLDYHRLITVDELEAVHRHVIAGDREARVLRACDRGDGGFSSAASTIYWRNAGLRAKKFKGLVNHNRLVVGPCRDIDGPAGRDSIYSVLDSVEGIILPDVTPGVAGTIPVTVHVDRSWHGLNVEGARAGLPAAQDAVHYSDIHRARGRKIGSRDACTELAVGDEGSGTISASPLYHRTVNEAAAHHAEFERARSDQRPVRVQLCKDRHERRCP